MAVKQIQEPEGMTCVGVITGVRGLRGELLVKSFTADPMDIGAYGPVSDAKGTRSFTIKAKSVVKGKVVARIKGTDDRTAAEAMKGVELFVSRDALPAPEEGEFYQSDLVGLRAATIDGEDLGTVIAVYDFGAGDLLEIAGSGKPLVVPFTKTVVPEVDIKAGRIVVDPVPGLLETGEES